MSAQPSSQYEESLQLFQSLHEEYGGDIPLFPAACLISALCGETLPQEWLPELKAEMDEMVQELIRLDLSDMEPLAKVETFAVWFSESKSFNGNSEDYYHPVNSSIYHVLKTRRGLPITLSVVLIELGKRGLDLELKGVGLPGHFMVQASSEDNGIYIDPFYSSRIMSMMDVLNSIGPEVKEVEELQSYIKFLIPHSPVQILSRIIENLKATFLARGDAKSIARCLDWLLILQPQNLFEKRNRGLIRLRLGELASGAQDLQEYLSQLSQPDDEEFIRDELQRAIASRSKLN